MEFRHLVYFTKVAELQHLTKAANDLFVSQSHLSHVIGEMEEELGVPLFDRVGRGLKLNPYGKEFYLGVVKQMAEFEDLKKRVNSLYHQSVFQLTVATNVSTYMPALLRASHLALPQVNVQQFSEKRRKIIRMLRDGSADFGIICPAMGPDPDLFSIQVHVEEGILIYPEGHWLEGRTSVSLSELGEEQFVSVSAGYGLRDIQDIILRKAGIFATNAVETTETLSIYNFVNNGLGIALAPRGMTMERKEFRERHVDVLEEPVGTISLTWKADRYFSEAAEAFKQIVISFFEAVRTHNEGNYRYHHLKNE